MATTKKSKTRTSRSKASNKKATSTARNRKYSGGYVRLPKTKPARIKLAAFVAIFAIIGTCLILASNAATVLLATINPSNMSLTKGARVWSSSEFVIAESVTSSASFTTKSVANKINITAKGMQCNGAPQMVVKVDGAQVLSTAVTNTDYGVYSAAVNLPAGTHTLSLAMTNDYNVHVNPSDTSSDFQCDRNLFFKASTVYGEVAPPKPTIKFTSSSNSLQAGQSATLTWSTTDATSCTAVGSWSGNKPVNGSQSTGALSSNVLYALKCTGPGGENGAGLGIYVTPASAPTPPPPPTTSYTLPKYGIATGWQYGQSLTDLQRAQMRATAKQLTNGKPTVIRFDYSNSILAHRDAVVQETINAGFVPMLTMNSTDRSPRTATQSDIDFAKSTVAKYGTKVYYEMGNEPDLNAWTADQYAAWIGVVGRAMKSVNPNVVISTAGVFNAHGGGKAGFNPLASWATALSTKAKGAFDLFAIHPYGKASQREYWNIWDMAFPVINGQNSVYKGITIREVLNNNGLSNVKIIATEAGDGIKDDGTHSETWQADAVGQAIDQATGGLIANVDVFTPYERDFAGFGLIRSDGSFRPAYNRMIDRTR